MAPAQESHTVGSRNNIWSSRYQVFQHPTLCILGLCGMSGIHLLCYNGCSHKHKVSGELQYWQVILHLVERLLPGKATDFRLGMGFQKLPNIQVSFLDMLIWLFSFLLFHNSLHISTDLQGTVYMISHKTSASSGSVPAFQMMLCFHSVHLSPQQVPYSCSSQSSIPRTEWLLLLNLSKTSYNKSIFPLYRQGFNSCLT